MRNAVSIGFVVAWDNDGPPRRPSLPVRCLEDELVTPVAFPTAPPHKLRIEVLQDVQGKGEICRRPGLTKATKHE